MIALLVEAATIGLMAAQEMMQFLVDPEEIASTVDAAMIAFPAETAVM